MLLSFETSCASGVPEAGTSVATTAGVSALYLEGRFDGLGYARNMVGGC